MCVQTLNKCLHFKYEYYGINIQKYCNLFMLEKETLVGVFTSEIVIKMSITFLFNYLI